MNEEYESNKGVQGTLHKVSGPLTPDVRGENDWCWVADTGWRSGKTNVRTIMGSDPLIALRHGQVTTTTALPCSTGEKQFPEQGVAGYGAQAVRRT